MTKHIKSLKIEVIEHRLYKRDPLIHGTGPDNIITVDIENIVTAEFTDGTISNSVRLEAIMIEKRIDGPEAN